MKYMFNVKGKHFFKDFIYLLLDRGEGREEERERHVVASHAPPPPTGPWACALTGNQTSDPLVRRLALNPLSHTSQGKGKHF